MPLPCAHFTVSPARATTREATHQTLQNEKRSGSTTARQLINPASAHAPTHHCCNCASTNKHHTTLTSPVSTAVPAAAAAADANDDDADADSDDAHAHAHAAHAATTVVIVVVVVIILRDPRTVSASPPSCARLLAEQAHSYRASRPYTVKR